MTVKLSQVRFIKIDFRLQHSTHAEEKLVIYCKWSGLFVYLFFVSSALHLLFIRLQFSVHCFGNFSSFTASNCCLYHSNGAVKLSFRMQQMANDITADSHYTTIYLFRMARHDKRDSEDTHSRKQNEEEEE